MMDGELHERLRRIQKRLDEEIRNDPEHATGDYSGWELFCCEFIYLFGPMRCIICGDLNVIKVGFTSDPKGNLASLRRANPQCFYWACRLVYNRGRLIESILHALWHSHRRSGEFFGLPYREIDWFINGLPDSEFQKHRINYVQRIADIREEFLSGSPMETAASPPSAPHASSLRAPL